MPSASTTIERLTRALLLRPLGAALVHVSGLNPGTDTKCNWDAAQLPDPKELDMVSLRLILATACLPVIEAAVRILRTAHEFGRSTLRFRATSNNLKRL